MATATIVTENEYLPLRLSLLEKEKELTHLQDELNKQRNELPLVAIDKEYTFTDSDNNKQATLRDLFGDRKQLIVYHAMFDPDDDEACPNCTLVLDHIPLLDHLRSHNTNLVVVSRAKPEKIKAYKAKLGYDHFRWYSSYGNDFNYDYGVTVDNNKNSQYNFRSSSDWEARKMPFFARGEQPGYSVFGLGGDLKDGGVGAGEKDKVYFSYSTYARGGEPIMTTIKLLDWTPLGRQDGVPDVEYKRRYEYTSENVGTNA